MIESIHSKHILLETGPNYRMVIISDIHGHASVLKDLLNKINLKTDDYLVILGDFINKGPESLEVLTFLTSFSHRPRTYILKGNHESFITTHIQSEVKFKDMMTILKTEPYGLILHDMAKHMNFDLYNGDDSECFRQLLLKNFKEEFEFLDSRPILLENESFILVHAGYDKEFCPERDEGQLLKYDFYNDHSPVHDKTVIVGHWPASNLRTDIMTNLPFFNDEKNLITIDGGLGVKSSGELNAFIITSEEGGISYDNMQSNTFEERVITHAMKLPEEELISVTYPHFDIEILESDHRYTSCRHVHSGKVFSVFNSLLYEEEGKNWIKTNYINRFFNLSEGDKVEICNVFDDCIQVKYNNEFGWILPLSIR